MTQIYVIKVHFLLDNAKLFRRFNSLEILKQSKKNQKVYYANAIFYRVSVVNFLYPLLFIPYYSPSSFSAIALPSASHCAFTSGVIACFISTGSPTGSKCNLVSFHS